MKATVSGGNWGRCTQVQHFAQHHAGRQAFADQAHDFAHQQQLLGAPLRLGRGAGVAWMGKCGQGRGHGRTQARSWPA